MPDVADALCSAEREARCFASAIVAYEKNNDPVTAKYPSFRASICGALLLLWMRGPDWPAISTSKRRQKGNNVAASPICQPKDVKLQRNERFCRTVNRSHQFLSSISS